MINYNELLPVLLVGLICGIVACIDRYKSHLQERTQGVESESEPKEAAVSGQILILDLIRNVIYSTIFACSVFWLSLFATENYLIRLGISIIISILGMDRALSMIEKFIHLKR